MEPILRKIYVPAPNEDHLEVLLFGESEPPPPTPAQRRLPELLVQATSLIARVQETLNRPRPLRRKIELTKVVEQMRQIQDDITLHLTRIGQMPTP